MLSDELLRAYAEKHNRFVVSGDIEPLMNLFDESATIRFEGIPFPELVGKDAIREAFLAHPPTDELLIQGVTSFQEKASCGYSWNSMPNAVDGTLSLVMQQDRIVHLTISSI